MHLYHANVSWARHAGDFARGRYSRAHVWQFDGGITVPASSSPLVVPVPFSTAEAVDPEEALVAAAASCHMLTFLFLAGKRGFVIDRYEDDAEGLMEKNARDKFAITRITLHPRIVFSGDTQPTAADLEALHHGAHDECYIANSITADIVVA